MFKRLALASAVIAATHLPAGALAQDVEPAQPGVLEETMVWGTQVRASSVYLQEDAIAIKQADHISDLLRPIPGVDVGGAHSLNQRITIRSMDDKDLRITIDGANQNTYMYHHMGNLQIHADILKSVDIEVGTNSVVNGGLGGAVRFETKDADDLLASGDRIGARVQASYATNDSQSLALTGYGRLTDSVDVLGYYNLVERGNYEVGGGEILDENGDEIPGTDGTVRGLEGDLDDALIKLGWDLTPTQRFEIGYESYNDEGDYSYRPDMGLATDLAIADNLGLPLTYDTRFTRDTWTLNYDGQFGMHSTVKAALFRNISTLWRDESAIADLWPGDPATVEGEAINTGFNVLASSAITAGVEHDFTYGLDVIRYETLYTTDGVDRSDEEATNAALFLEDRLELGSRWAVIPGVRYEQWDVSSSVVDETYDDLNGALALEFNPISSLLFKLSATQLFKGLEIGEVFVGAGLYETPNPAIEAEGGLNTELVLAYESRLGALDNVSAGFTLFRTEIDNYIYDYAPHPDPAIRGWKDNVGDMQVDGWEAYAGFTWNNLHSLLTWSVAESDLAAFEGYSALEGARLDRQQGDTLTLALDYDIPEQNVSLHWDLFYVENVPAALDLDGATLDNSKDGFLLHNVSARWLPAAVEGLEVTVGVDNLFDEFYASQSSRTGVSRHPRFGELYLQDFEPGRNFKTTVAYRF